MKQSNFLSAPPPGQLSVEINSGVAIENHGSAIA